MVDALGAAPPQFDFGRVVGQTFALTGRNFLLFLLLSLLFVGIPQFALLYFQSASFASQNSGSMGLLAGVGALVSVLTTFILQGALTRAAVDDLSGVGVKSGAALGDGLRYFFPLLIVGILVGLGVGLGLMLFLIPGIYLAVRWVIAAPITVIERDGPSHAMGRSSELTEGYRWAIFGLILLYFGFAWCVELAVGFGLEAVRPGASQLPLLVMDPVGIGLSVALIVVTALVTLVSSVGAASLYFELRRVKEGVSVDQLASVFD